MADLGAYLRSKGSDPTNMRSAIAQQARVERAHVVERVPVRNQDIFESDVEEDFDRTDSFTQLERPLRTPTPQAPPVPQRASVHPLEAQTPRKLDSISGSPSGSEYEEKHSMPVRTREDLPEPRRQLLENLTTPRKRAHPIEQTTPRSTPRSKTSVQSSRSPSPSFELDYPEGELRRLDFDELVKQPFDTIPGPDLFTGQLPDSLKKGALPDRLGLLLKEREDVQRTFLSSLPINEWEEAGDWFLEKFGEMMGKIVAARKEKRRVALSLEEEIAKRENLVGKRKDALEQALSEMKQGGMSVLGRSSY